MGLRRAFSVSNPTPLVSESSCVHNNIHSIINPTNEYQPIQRTTSSPVIGRYVSSHTSLQSQQQQPPHRKKFCWTYQFGIQMMIVLIYMINNYYNGSSTSNYYKTFQEYTQQRRNSIDSTANSTIASTRISSSARLLSSPTTISTNHNENKRSTNSSTIDTTNKTDILRHSNNHSTVMNDDENNIVTTTTTSGILLLPQQILAQYKLWHSNHVLISESEQEQQNNRLYSIAYYSCPLQAGNRMHHFMNSIIWSIVTNRTVLYKYLDTDTCEYHQSVQTQIWHDPMICVVANQEDDCNAFLHRASWIPSYNDWSHHIIHADVEYNNTVSSWNMSDIVTVVDYWATRSYQLAPKWERTRFLQRNVSEPDIRLIDTMDDIKIIDFPELVGKDFTLSYDIQRRSILSTPEAQYRAQALFSEGTEFVYGMLFKDLFQLHSQPSIDDPLIYPSTNNERNVQPDPQHINNDIYRIAVHSRHSKGQEGTFVKKEKNCFHRMLQPLQSTNTKCSICIMSDRPKTIEILSQWITETYNCSVITAENIQHGGNNHSTSWLSEHGPNAGVQFFHDLDTCQYYTDGLIGTGGGSSSTQLLEEWIEYNRKVQQQSLHVSNVNATIPPVHKCWI